MEFHSMYYYDEADYISMFDALGFNLPRGHSGIVRCNQHTDKHPSMSINLTTGLFNCFSCGYHGRVDKAYKEHFGFPFAKKAEYSADELKNIFSTRNKPRIISTEKSYFQATFDACKSPILRNWLEYRGIDLKVADAAKVFYGAVNISYKDDSGEMKSYVIHDRVVFPVYDEKHQLVSLEMRFPFFGTEPKAFKETVKKVLYPKNSSVNLLYDQENLDKSKKLYVAEGLMDCLAFRSLTKIRNSTSIFGANITQHQKELLNEFPEICYVYNNDTAGLKSLQSLKDCYKGKFSELKPAGDFDDVGEMAMNKFNEVKEWLKTEKI